MPRYQSKKISCRKKIRRGRDSSSSPDLNSSEPSTRKLLKRGKGASVTVGKGATITVPGFK